MKSPLRQLTDSGTKLWVDSIDPVLVSKNLELGATGATSNPIIIADLIKTGRFDDVIMNLAKSGHGVYDLTWALTDKLVSQAEQVFLPVWQKTKGDDGYVSFELDPLLEDHDAPRHDERVEQYISLGKKWSKNHPNRMIKVPATPAGLAALEELIGAGVAINVTLIFSKKQYEAARDACWRGAQKIKNRNLLKSVYSIFVSRVDVYTEKHVQTLSKGAQGQVGIVNAKRIWLENQRFWLDKDLPLKQEIVFASTGTKNPEDPAHKYVGAFAGSDIETNPPATNDAVDASGITIKREIDRMPPPEILREIDKLVDFSLMESVLMTDGLQKFTEPQKSLYDLIESRIQKANGTCQKWRSEISIL